MALANGDDRGRQILQQTAGAVLFGVPTRGIETQALLMMMSKVAADSFERVGERVARARRRLLVLEKENRQLSTEVERLTALLERIG